MRIDPNFIAIQYGWAVRYPRRWSRAKRKMLRSALTKLHNTVKPDRWFRVYMKGAR